MVARWNYKMKPVLATYGASDNSHKLLNCDDPQVILPWELEGLTDRPPGDIAPDDIWWPSVGCGPVGDWWCLWWTQPDLLSSRAGMVCSKVALWSLEHVKFIEDLIPIFPQISGGKTLDPASEDLLVQVAEAMLFAREQAVVACNNLEDWPRIIAGIWCRLWPAARIEFSARLALSPPQIGVPDNLPLIIGVPISHAQQWQRPYTKVEPQIRLPEGTLFNRASWFLAGRTDSAMNEILNKIPPRQSDLAYLTRAARVADNLEKIKKSANFDDALALLRTLIVMASSAEEAAQYKEIAVTTISLCLPSASPEQIESLANLDLSSVPKTEGLRESLRKRLEALAPQLSIDESISLFSKLNKGKAQLWWQSCVETVLRYRLDSLDYVWTLAAISWLAASQLEEVFIGLIKNDGDVESKLLKAAKEKTWSVADLVQLGEQAKKRKWSILHAWTLVTKNLSTEDAFSEQNDFTGNPIPGFDYLIHTLPTEKVLNTIVAMDDPTLCRMAAKLTKSRPNLLRWIDITNKDRL
jgi:hypothetical protein